MADSLTDRDHRIGRHLKLRDLQILSAVVQWGGMGRAAGHLGVTQPSVSEAIASLEAAVGVKLLDRNSRGVAPTIYATALLKRGSVIFDELRQGLNDIEFLSDPNRGEVRIGCPETLMAGFLPAIIDKMSRAHPNVAVYVAHSDAATLEFRELRERQIDLVLGRISSPQSDDELNVEDLFKERYFVVAGAQSRWARRRKISLTELTQEPWVQMTPNTLINTIFVEAFHAQYLEPPRQSVTTLSMHLRIHLLATGRYLSIIPESMLIFNAKPWGLKILPIDLHVRPRSVVIFTLKNRTLGPAVQLFLQHARGLSNTMRGTVAGH